MALLAGLPDPSGDIDAQAPAVAPPRTIPDGHPPTMAINELAQQGRLADLDWSFHADGSPHQPTHTCRVTARQVDTGQRRTATGAGSTKAAAKSAAAAALWTQLRGGRAVPLTTAGPSSPPG